MGQKVNPIGMRLRINRDWESNWFAEGNDYGVNLIEDLKIRNFIYSRFLHSRDYNRVEISNVKIVRVGKFINVYVYNSRPGLLIGKKGQDIERLKEDLRKTVGIKNKINISMNEVKDVDTNAHSVSQIVGKSVESRVPYKRAIKQILTRSMKSGARGVKVRISGRLNGADMSRTETFKEGSIPLHTLDAVIDYAHYDAMTTYGVIGVAVWIYRDTLSKKNFKKMQEASFSKG